MTLPTVDLWHTDLDASPDGRSLLTDQERQRAHRFRFALDRDRFVARRAFLRSVLGRYLDRAPRSVMIEQTSGGKPASRDDPRLHFNLSASGPTAVLAVADEEVGVDVEMIRDGADVDSITGRWFTPGEHAAIDGLDDGDRVTAVFEIITRKEAVLKAAGVGFALSPALIDVIAPGPVVVPTVPPTTWRVQSLSPHPTLAAALATREGSPKLAFHPSPNARWERR
jgi:4'-phosphopantetheinyl transferase